MFWSRCSPIYCFALFHCALQTARFLLKALLAGKSGKPVGGSASYLGALQQELGSRCSARGTDCWANPGE
jgi:HEPN domain-containing protein